MGTRSNEVISAEIQGFKSLIEEKFTNVHSVLERIEEQTKKTNGRVTKLEELKNKIIGALVLTNIVVVPTLFILIKHYFDMK